LKSIRQVRLRTYARIGLIIILIVAGFFLISGAPSLGASSKSDLVTNGGFEEGMTGWKPGSPLAGEVAVVDGISNSGSHSLRIVGPGQGYLQEFEKREIIPETQLKFSTRLEAKKGENEPQALFHLYFLPMKNGPVYYLDVTVTHDNSEDVALLFEPNPGVDKGGIYLRFNREPLDSWINISVDVSRLIERYFPDYFDSRISGLLLESAEGGMVYFDDISVTNSNINPSGRFLYLTYYFLAINTTGKTIAEVLAILTPVVSLGVWAYRRLKQKSDD